MRSVTLGFWIGTGSAGEDEAQAGLSHLVEHMLFRGTDRYESVEIDQIFDAMGAELNAGTGKEATSVYARVLDEHLPAAFDVVADIVWRPRFSADDLANEREIVLEELAMYEDDPQDKVFDVLGEAVFGSHPLGRAILGRAEVVAGTPAEGLAAFHAARYVPRNVVIAAAGSVDHDELVAMVLGAGIPDRAADAVVVPAPQPRASTARFLTKETEQYHVCLGAPGLARDDERRFVLRILDNVLGGTSSSRLFQEVRERRGLAYNVFSFNSLYAGTGQTGLYLGTRPDNVGPALEIVATELQRVRSEPVGADELSRAKDNVKGRMVLGLESTAARMNRLGASVLNGLPLLSVDEVVEHIERVTAADVHELAAELLAPERLSAAGVGVAAEPFRRALEPVAPALAATAPEVLAA